jgi:hypothetical protein
LLPLGPVSYPVVSVASAPVRRSTQGARSSAVLLICFCRRVWLRTPVLAPGHGFSVPVGRSVVAASLQFCPQRVPHGRGFLLRAKLRVGRLAFGSRARFSAAWLCNFVNV